MKAIEVHEHMKEVGTWVDWNNTVDRFIIGDAQTEVEGIAVGWQSRTGALKEALKRGCNLFITHEPTFYRHLDRGDGLYDHSPASEKKKLIEDNGLVVYRCHDCWDQMPKVGIVDSWGAHLGLKNKLASEKFHSVYESPAPTLLGLAKHVAASTSYLKQSCVEMVGEANAKVSKVAIGCGAITHYRKMLDLGADALIGTDDGMRYWYSGAWALESGTPLIVVNHATAEEPGMKNLAKYVAEQFPGVRVEHIPQGCMFQVVR